MSGSQPTSPPRPELTNIVPPDQGARRGWAYAVTNLGAATQADRLKFTQSLEHVTAGAGYEICGAG
jgi:hypothetical protein